MDDASLDRLDNSTMLIETRTEGSEATGTKASAILSRFCEFCELGGGLSNFMHAMCVDENE